MNKELVEKILAFAACAEQLCGDGGYLEYSGEELSGLRLEWHRGVRTLEASSPLIADLEALAQALDEKGADFFVAANDQKIAVGEKSRMYARFVEKLPKSRLEVPHRFHAEHFAWSFDLYFNLSFLNGFEISVFEGEAKEPFAVLRSEEEADAFASWLNAQTEIVENEKTKFLELALRLDKASYTFAGLNFKGNSLKWGIRLAGPQAPAKYVGSFQEGAQESIRAYSSDANDIFSFLEERLRSVRLAESKETRRHFSKALFEAIGSDFVFSETTLTLEVSKDEAEASLSRLPSLSPEDLGEKGLEAAVRYASGHPRIEKECFPSKALRFGDLVFFVYKCPETISYVPRTAVVRFSEIALPGARRVRSAQ